MTCSSRGSFAPPRDWAALRRAYEAPGADPVQVAAANNILPSTLRTYARAKGWSLGAGRDGDDPPATSPNADISIPHGALTKRLRMTVAVKLEKLEMDMLDGGPLSPTDHERHSRAIGALAKAVEIADDDSQADSAASRRAIVAKPAAAPETAGDDADKLRRELAARIKRLRERLAG